MMNDDEIDMYTRDLRYGPGLASDTLPLQYLL